MKARYATARNHGLTIFEILVIIVCIVVLASMILPVLIASKCPCQKINCVSNLKQVNLALRIWEEDNNDRYPMGVSVTNGGGMELIAKGNVAGCLQIVSNELSTPKILVCPEDKAHTWATNFDKDFNNSHVSYFVGAGVTNEGSPDLVLDGDDNLLTNGTPMKSGLSALSANSKISWTRSRHYPSGNISFADGSVQAFSSQQIEQSFQQTGLATNRIAIP